MQIDYGYMYFNGHPLLYIYIDTHSVHKCGCQSKDVEIIVHGK